MAFPDYSPVPSLNTTIGDSTFIGPNMARANVRPALQQLAADGRLLSNRVEEILSLGEGPAGPAGSVGDYTGTLLSSGTASTRYRTTLGSAINGNGGDDQADFSIVRSRASWAANHGGSGAPYQYFDDTAGIASNLTAGAVRINSALPGAGLFFEPRFFQAGVFATEIQIRFVGLDGVERRPIQFFCPHDGGTVRDIANGSFQTDVINWYDWLGVQRASWNLRTGAFSHAIGTNYLFENNTPALSFKNAAGLAFVNSWYLDNNDSLLALAPLVINGAMKTSAVAGQPGGITAQFSGAANDARLDQIVSVTAVTGYMWGFWREASADQLYNQIKNTKANGQTFFDLIPGSGGSAEYQVNSTKVVGARDTGWAADTGTAKKTANATYAPGATLTYSAAYVQAELTATATRLAAVEAALRDATQTIKALKDALITHGLIGT